MNYSMPPSMYPQPGELLDGKFEVRQMLGEGGMGAVMKGWDRELHRDVALKFMSPHLLMMPGAVERFLMEAQAAARVRNDHVVDFYARGVLSNGTPFLVMEYLEGQDLAAIVEKQGISAIPVARAVHFVLQVLRALQVAHGLNVIHRDMKPSNCFVVHREGEDDFVKVVDFGISKIQDPGNKGGANLTKTNSALGTPLYMSPEQAKSPRDVDHRSDLYSVAAILYELLTGRTPYLSETGEFAEILVKLLTQQPTPLGDLRPDLPESLVAAVHKGLAAERDDRFRDAADFAEAIAPWADDRSAWVLRRLRSDRRNSMELPKDAEFPFMRTAAPGSIAPPANPGVATQKGYVPKAPAAVPATTPMPSSMSRGEMVARTIASDHPPAAGAGAISQPGASSKGAETGVGVSRDATPSSVGKKSSAPLVIGGIVGALVILGGSYAGVTAMTKGPSTTTPEPSASVADPRPSATVATTQPSAVATVAIPSSAPSASTAPVIASTKPVVVKKPTGPSASAQPSTTTVATAATTENPLDFKPKN